MNLTTTEVSINSNFWTILTYIHVFVWFPASVIIGLYLLMGGGSKAYLYTSLASMSMTMIEDFVSGTSFLLHSTVLLILFIQYFSKSFAWLYLFMFLVYGGLAYYLETTAWEYGIDALKRIDPYWNERSGDLLLPKFFYTIRGDEPVSNNEDSADEPVNQD